MKVYTYLEAYQNFSMVLDIAKYEDVIINRQGGEMFRVTFSNVLKSPFDVAGIQTKAITKDILDAVKESRSG